MTCSSEVTQLLYSVRRASSKQHLPFRKRRHTDQLPGTECVSLTGSGFLSSSQTGSRTSRQVFHPTPVTTPPASMLEGLKHSSSEHKDLQRGVETSHWWRSAAATATNMLPLPPAPLSVSSTLCSPSCLC